MIGRHHARLLQASPRVAFVGAVDPGGDRFGAVHDHGRLFGDLDALLRAGAPDFAIVAVPTEDHVATVRKLAGEGIHVLVEKPLAATAAEGRVLIDACIPYDKKLAGSFPKVVDVSPELRAKLRQKFARVFP